jgi:hypothetical protein
MDSNWNAAQCSEVQSGIAGRCVLTSCYFEVDTRSFFVATISPNCKLLAKTTCTLNEELK